MQGDWSVCPCHHCTLPETQSDLGSFMLRTPPTVRGLFTLRTPATARGVFMLPIPATVRGLCRLPVCATVRGVFMLPISATVRGVIPTISQTLTLLCCLFFTWTA